MKMQTYLLVLLELTWLIIYEYYCLLACCFVASCVDPGLIDGGKRNGNDFSHGQFVSYECTVQGKSLVGDPRLTCNDGTWDSANPICKSEHSNNVYIWLFLSVAETMAVYLLCCGVGVVHYLFNILHDVIWLSRHLTTIFFKSE